MKRIVTKALFVGFGPSPATAFPLAGAALLTCLGCGNAETPGGLVQCTSDTMCALSEICFEGYCVFQSDPFVRDGGLMDADLPDSGPADAGKPDAGQPRCMTPDCNRCEDLHPTALICENFDEPVEAPWAPSLGAGATLSLTDTEFLSGGGSLLASAPAQNNSRYRRAIDPPIESGDLYVRAYAMLRAPTSLAGPLVLVNLSNDTADKVSLDLERMGTAQVFQTGGLKAGSGPNAITPNRWTCLEFHFRVAEPSIEGLLSLSIDGQAVNTLSPAPVTLPSGGFSELAVGIAAVGAQNTEPIEVLLDELVVATDGPIGCIP